MLNSTHDIAGSIVVLTFATFTIACGPDQPPEPSQPSVVVDAAYDKSVDFSDYESFDVADFEAFDDEPPPPGYTANSRRDVENAIIDELTSRGLEFDDVNPDLRISPFVRLTKTQVVDETWWWDGYWGWYWGYAYATPWYDQDVLEFDTGTLVIDAVDLGDADDVSDDVLVFRGTATALFWDPASYRPGRIAGAVDDVFDFWPGKESS